MDRVRAFMAVGDRLRLPPGLGSKADGLESEVDGFDVYDSQGHHFVPTFTDVDGEFRLQGAYGVAARMLFVRTKASRVDTRP